MSGKKFAIVTAINAQSMASTITGTGIDVLTMDNLGFQFTYTGTPTGTLSLEASNDNVAYVAITSSPAISALAGSAGTQITTLINFPYRYVRVKYTATSGSGTLTAYVSMKAY